jgi:hypothetical protein
LYKDRHPREYFKKLTAKAPFDEEMDSQLKNILVASQTIRQHPNPGTIELELTLSEQERLKKEKEQLRKTLGQKLLTHVLQDKVKEVGKETGVEV